MSDQEDIWVPDVTCERLLNGHNTITYARVLCENEWRSLNIWFPPQGLMQLSTREEIPEGAYRMEVVSFGYRGQQKTIFPGAIVVDKDGSIKGTLDVSGLGDLT